MFHPKFHIHSNTGRCFSAPTRKYCQAWVYCPNPSHGFVFPTPLDNPLSILPFLLFFFLTLFFFVQPLCLWDLSSPARDWTQTMAVKTRNANQQTTRKLPLCLLPFWSSLAAWEVGSAFLRSSSSEQPRPPLSAEPGAIALSASRQNLGTQWQNSFPQLAQYKHYPKKRGEVDLFSL